MAYLSLPARRVELAADKSGFNEGNLTFNFTNDVITAKPSQFELYHAAIPSGIPSGTLLTVYLGTQLFSVAQLESIGDWDPAQPMLLQPGQDVYACTNILIADLPTPTPVMTCWFRYDSTFI
jgi:hypothetical protein